MSNFWDEDRVAPTATADVNWWSDDPSAPAQTSKPASPAAPPRKLQPAAGTAAPAEKKATFGETMADAMDAFGSSATHAFVRLPGMVGDVQGLLSRTFDRVTGDFGPKFKAEQEKWAAEHGIKSDPDLKNNPVLRDYRPQMPTGELIDDIATNVDLPFTDRTGIVGKRYEPKTDVGRVADVVGNYAPAIIGAPGPLAAAERLAWTTVGSEGAKTVAKVAAPDEPVLEEWASLLGGAGGFKLGEVRGNRIWRQADEGITRKASDAAERVKQVYAELLADESGTVGKGGDDVTPRKGPPPRPPKPDPINWAAAQNGKLTPEKFDETVAPYIRQGVDPFEFQGYGPQAGVAKMAAYSRMPGETGALVREALDGPPPAMGEKPSGARYELQERALKSLDEMSGRSTSVLEREMDLNALQKQMQPEWEPVLSQNMSRKAISAMKPIIDRIWPDDLAAIIEGAKKLGHAEGFPASKWSSARKYQYIKRMLWNFAEKLGEHPETAARGAAYKGLYAKMNDVLHDPEIGVPGYASLDSRFATIQQAHDAMVLGGKAFAKGDTAMPADRVAHQFDETPHPVKPYYQTGAAQRIYNQIAGKTEGYDPGNIARDQVTMQKLETVFGPERAAKFIDSQRLIHKDAGDYNTIDPSRNSVTALALNHGAEGLVDAANAAKAGPGELSMHLARSIADHLLNEGMASRDKIGAQMITKMTPQRMKEFRDQLVEFEAEKRRAAIANALVAAQPHPSPDNR